MQHWNPLQDLMSLQDRMNRLFEESMSRSRTGAEDVGGWTPAADIYETESEFVIKVELAEVDKESFDVRIESNTLTLRGERKFSGDVKKEQYRHIERHYGPFHRSFVLPGGLDQDKVEASFKDGVLRLVVQKSPEGQSRTIRIEAGE